MIIEAWMGWAILAAILIITEIFTTSFFLLWFGIGAAAAALLAYLGVNIAWQLGGFVAISGVLFAISRKLAQKLTREQPSGIGADRFVGKEGVVLEEINNIENRGRVRIGGEEWRAESEVEEIIPLGKKVKVSRLEGTHLVVNFFKKEAQC